MRDIHSFLCDILKYIKSKYDSIKEDKEVVLEIMDMLTEMNRYDFNFGELHKFFEKSDLIRKLNGFI
jgi:hypothetical protein